MEKVWIHCPECRKTSKLFLTSRPFLMILNCPVCRSTLICNQGNTLKLNDMNFLKTGKNNIQGFIEKIKSQLPEKRKSVSRYASKQLLSPSSEICKSLSGHKMGEPLKPTPVSKDDILNLKIALESCEDVSDFIKII